MYRIPIYRISLVRESSQAAETRNITNPNEAAIIFRDFIGVDADRECFALMLLDIRHKVIGLNMVSIGTLFTSVVHPREVFKPAILHNAAAIVVAHNHPSGETSPSTEDIQITKRLKDAGELLGISLLDHLILANGLYESLKERGHIH